MYDRGLTDQKSPLDPTEAWIDGENRGLSSNNAIRTYRTCERLIPRLTGIPFDQNTWNTCDSKHRHLSAQGWINLYNHLVDIGEMNLINERTVGELHIE